MALVAPRGLMMYSGYAESAGNPFGFEQAYRSALRVYQFLGREQNIWLHLREGEHETTGGRRRELHRLLRCRVRPPRACRRSRRGFTATRSTSGGSCRASDIDAGVVPGQRASSGPMRRRARESASSGRSARSRPGAPARGQQAAGVRHGRWLAGRAVQASGADATRAGPRREGRHGLGRAPVRRRSQGRPVLPGRQARREVAGRDLAAPATPIRMAGRSRRRGSPPGRTTGSSSGRRFRRS